MFIAAQDTSDTTSTSAHKISAPSETNDDSVSNDMSMLKLQNTRTKSKKPSVPSVSLQVHSISAVNRDVRLSIINSELSSNVECPDCLCKLGRWSYTESPCPCGILIPGILLYNMIS